MARCLPFINCVISRLHQGQHNLSAAVGGKQTDGVTVRPNHLK